MIGDAPGWLWAVLATLLLLSALFSASETALFSLSGPDRRKASAGIRALLSEPRSLLASILLCNLVVNVLFFAFSGRLLAEGGALQGVIIELGALLAIVIGGEILPKTIGLRASIFVSRLGLPILLPVVRFIGPLAGPLARMLESFNQWLSSWMKEERRITPEILAGVLERGTEEGLLLDMEADLLAEVIELDDIRVREIMTPRVDVLVVDVSEEDPAARVEEALRARQDWLPVVDGNRDRVVGRVRVRDLLRRRGRTLRQLVMPVKFVPEVASALDLLRGLREDRTAEAIVVDEWGGTAGIVTAEDVFEEIVGDIRAEGESRTPPTVPLGEGRYRVAGSLSIRDWNEMFGLNVVPTEFETVGGFVTAELGRIPRTGDVVRAEDLVMTVHEVRGRRVVTVDIGVAVGRPGEGRTES